MADKVTPIGLRVRPDGIVEGALIPPGVVMHSAADAPPDGWLVANGAAVSRATYSDLFAEIGVKYGAGDGANTFNLPDLTDRFIRGDTVAPVGQVGGAASHSHTVNPHNHTIPNGSNDFTVRAGLDIDVSGFNHNHTGFTGNASPGTDAQSNIPPRIDLLPIIKF